VKVKEKMNNETITATIIKIVSHKSKYGGYFYYLFFKSSNGKSYKTCLYPSCSNFQRWLQVIQEVKQGKEVWLTGLFTLSRSKYIIDADSQFQRL